MTKEQKKNPRLKFILFFIILIMVFIGILIRNIYIDSKDKSNTEKISQDLINEEMTSKNIDGLVEYVQENKQILDDFIKGHEEILMAMGQEDDIINLEEAGSDQEADLQVLVNLQKSNDEILNAYMGTETGNMYLYPPVNLPEWFVAKDRPWYISALDAPSIFWTEPYFNADASVWTITNAIKVENEGRLVGVVATDLSLDNLMQLLEEKNTDFELIVISSYGRYLLHPNQALIGLSVLDQGLLDKITDESGSFEYDPFKNMNPVPENASPWEIEIYDNLKIQTTKEVFYKKNALGWTLIGQLKK